MVIKEIKLFNCRLETNITQLKALLARDNRPEKYNNRINTPPADAAAGVKLTDIYLCRVEHVAGSVHSNYEVLADSAGCLADRDM